MFGVVRDISERKQIEAAQRNFTQRVLQTLEAERQRVARELHDDVGQAIATVGVLLHTLEHTPDAVRPEARPALGGDARHHSPDHRIGRAHRPRLPSRRAARPRHRGHASARTPRQFARRHGLSLRLATTAIAGVLPQEHELHLYRIIQEALANVARHAAARKVAVRLGRERRRVVAVVRDDGVGFTPDPGRTSGLGLVTMRERAELMGAELDGDEPAPRAAPRCASPSRSPRAPLRRGRCAGATPAGPRRPRPRTRARRSRRARSGRRGRTSIA